MARFRKSRLLRVTSFLTAHAMVLCTGLQANPLPTGGQVVSGAATILVNGTTMNIQQLSQNVFIDFDSFSIGVGNSVNYMQPGASSVAINKIVGADPSLIYGALTANGILYLLNPNGIIFAETAQVDVGGLVAGAYRNCFLDANGDFVLEGAEGDVANHGEIVATAFAALLGANVQNLGKVTAPRIDMGAVNRVVLPDIAGGKFTMTFEDAAGTASNQGTLEASQETNGGKVALFGATAEHSGTIRANGEQGDGGAIGICGKDVILTGTMSASGGVGGMPGHILIDPVAFTIDGTNVATLIGALDSADVHILAEDTIDVDAEFNSLIQLNSNTLSFEDENGDSALTINLRAPIVLGPSQVLTGEGTVVNVLSGGALVQNGIDVAAVGGTVEVSAGTYTEDLVISKDGLELAGADSATTTIKGVNHHTAGVEAGNSIGTGDGEVVDLNPIARNLDVRGSQWPEPRSS
ncbi:MAG: filamentous hemagglutinin N-terminal domain-containing protein, partial [Lentisphaerae bacterium]|nr:filamentous hemagglutinin N-terminal domain-containing protein [Lentisphaerota bacterium]